MSQKTYRSVRARIAALSMAAGCATALAEPVFVSSFDAAPPKTGSEWSSTNQCFATTQRTTAGETVFGRFSNGDVQLTLDNLPAHEHLVLAFDLHIIGAWQGEGANPSTITVTLEDGTVLMTSSFANDAPGSDRRQSYPQCVGQGENPAGFKAYKLDALRLTGEDGSMNRDSMYRVVLSGAHAGKRATVTFKASGINGSLAKAAWAIDNLAVNAAGTGADLAQVKLATQEMSRNAASYWRGTAASGITTTTNGSTSTYGSIGSSASSYTVAAYRGVIAGVPNQGLIFPQAANTGSAAHPGASGPSLSFPDATINDNRTAPEIAKRLPDQYAAAAQRDVYTSDFAKGAAGWSASTTGNGPKGAYLGAMHNQTATLTLNDLPAHDDLVVAADVVVAGDWQGNAPMPSLFTIGANGINLFSTTFAHGGGTGATARTQSFPAGAASGLHYPADTGAVDVSAMVLATTDGRKVTDSVYRIVTSLPHSSRQAMIDFAASNLAGDVATASWALSRVSIAARARSGMPTLAAGEQMVTKTDVVRTTNAARTARRRVEGNIYSSRFDGAPGSEWTKRNFGSAPWGETFVGPFHNEDNTLAFADLPEHDSLTLDMDLYTLGDWRGDGKEGIDPSKFSILLDDGTEVFASTFANEDGKKDRTQQFPRDKEGRPNLADSGAARLNMLGFTGESEGVVRDASYHLKFIIPHTAKGVGFTFKGAGLPGDVKDAAWALDNVTLSASGMREVAWTDAFGKEYDVNAADGHYYNPFAETPGNEWSNPRFALTPAGEGYIGPFGNEETTLTVSNLPEHTHMVIAADVIAAGDWRGNAQPNPSMFRIRLSDGTEVFATTFANDDGTGQLTQSYPQTGTTGNNIPGSGSVGVNTQGFIDPATSQVRDSTYRLVFTVPHGANVESITFVGSGLPGTPGGGGGAWGLDNVSVTTINSGGAYAGGGGSGFDNGYAGMVDAGGRGSFSDNGNRSGSPGAIGWNDAIDPFAYFNYPVIDSGGSTNNTPNTLPAVVPTPAGAAVLGLGAAVGLRRRRR